MLGWICLSYKQDASLSLSGLDYTYRSNCNWNNYFFCYSPLGERKPRKYSSFKSKFIFSSCLHQTCPFIWISTTSAMINKTSASAYVVTILLAVCSAIIFLAPFFENHGIMSFQLPGFTQNRISSIN